jgi:hypothetical protein
MSVPRRNFINVELGNRLQTLRNAQMNQKMNATFNEGSYCDKQIERLTRQLKEKDDIVQAQAAELRNLRHHMSIFQQHQQRTYENYLEKERQCAVKLRNLKNELDKYKKARRNSGNSKVEHLSSISEESEEIDLRRSDASSSSSSSEPSTLNQETWRYTPSEGYESSTHAQTLPPQNIPRRSSSLLPRESDVSINFNRPSSAGYDVKRIYFDSNE